MDWYGIAILVAIVAVMFGLFMIMIVKPKVKAKYKKNGWYIFAIYHL